MIMKAFIKVQAFLPKSYLHNILPQYFQSFSNSKQVSTQLRADLLQKLKDMNIKTQKSILVQQPQQQNAPEHSNKQPKKKINKFSFRKLTIPQKIELGILIPQAPFNMRMTKKCEQQYRQLICQNLYKAQKQNLNTSMRILQLQTSKTNIDQYINSIYKDIFSRYMVSRGHGIEWEAHNSHYGIMNQAEKTKQSRDIQIKQFYTWICELMTQYPLAKKQVIALYSYSNKKHIKISDVQIENMYKVGYYFKMQLTKFGRFKDSFDVLKDRNQKIQLLVMVQDPIKLLNVQAICIQPNKKMIILSKYQQKQTQQQASQSRINYFLVTSMDVYSQNQQYFSSNGYTKHLLFDSSHLLQMEVQNGIKIFNDIQAYSRKGGAYIIDRFSGLPDFERATQLQLNPLNSKRYFDEQGKLIKLSQKLGEPIYITDPKYSQKILQNLQICGIQAKKIDLFSTYQDQVYSYNNQKLHFTITDKYVIPIPQSHHQQLQQALQKSIISESKVIVPRPKPMYSKPRDKRRHIKQIRKLKEQQTQYMSLRDCLDTYDSLSFSTNISSPFTFPVFVSETLLDGEVSQQQIYINERVRKLIVQSLQIKEQNLIQWDLKKLQQFLNTLTSQIDKQNPNKIKIRIKLLSLSQNLFKGYQCFKNYSIRPQLSNIVIQPQSKTQDVVPYFFHMHYFIHKMAMKRNAKERGRKTKKSETNNKLFSLIKFHPTIDQSQRNRDIDQILFGVIKANNQQQYGYGLEALRLWVARHDSYLGDRRLNDKEINKQLPLTSFIRKIYWQILPLMNIDLNKIVIQNNQKYIELTPESNKIVPRQKLSYLHNFILDHINYYILNMEECYNKLNLSKAVQLTQDFFKNYLNQIFIKTVRKRMITYPFNQQNQQHIYVLRRIIELLAVVAPILPYSAYHISKTQLLPWPLVRNQDVRTQLIPNYNRMTKFRVQVRNKFLVNKFRHSQLVIPIQKSQNNEPNIVPQVWKLNKEDLQLFFDIENISFSQPKQQGKSCQLKLTQNHPLGKIPKIKFYQYKDVCIRCSPNHNYGTHLCEKCLNYLNSNFGRKLPLIT